MYVVEWFGELYGPFTNEQTAGAFAAHPPVRTENAMARGKVRPLRDPTTTMYGSQDDRPQRLR